MNTPPPSSNSEATTRRTCSAKGSRIWNFLGLALLAGGLVCASRALVQAVRTYKTLSHSISVRGLDERLVKSDQAIWRNTFVVTGETLPEAYQQLSQAQGIIRVFLTGAAIAPEEIEFSPPSITDARANSYQNNNQPRFSARASVTVSSSQVDALTKRLGETSSLVEKGVILESSEMKYYFTKLNEIKPEMLKAASAKAQEAASALARDSGAKLGSLIGVSQGLFTIASPISDDSYEATQSVMKKVRVVTSAEYLLKK